MAQPSRSVPPAPPQALYDRLRKFREQDAYERGLQGMGLAGAADAASRGLPLAQVLAMNPERPLEEEQDYEAQTEILGKMAELEKEKRAFAEKVGEATQAVMDAQKSQLQEVLKSIVDLEKSEQSANAATKSAQLSASADLSGKYAGFVMAGLDPNYRGLVDKEASALLQTQWAKDLQGPQGSGGSAPAGARAIDEANMQELIPTLQTSLANLDSPEARYALLAKMDSDLGLTGTPHSLVTLVVDPNIAPAATFEALTGTSLTGAAPDPAFSTGLSALRQSMGVSVGQAMSGQQAKLAAGDVAGQFASIVKRGGGASSTAAQDAVSTIYALLGQNKPLTTQQMLEVQKITGLALRGNPAYQALAQKLAVEIDQIPTEDDAKEAARKMAMDMFGYDPANLDKLYGAYQEMLGELQNKDPKTAYGQQVRIMATPEFQAFQEQSGIADPGEAWKALQRRTLMDERQLQAAGQAQGQAALPSAGAPPPAAQGPARATQYQDEGRLTADEFDDNDPFSNLRAPAAKEASKQNAQTTSTQALRESLKTSSLGDDGVPQPKDAEKLQSPDEPYQQVLASSKKDSLRRALLTGSPTTAA